MGDTQRGQMLSGRWVHPHGVNSALLYAEFLRTSGRLFFPPLAADEGAETVRLAVDELAAPDFRP